MSVQIFSGAVADKCDPLFYTFECSGKEFVSIRFNSTCGFFMPVEEMKKFSDALSDFLRKETEDVRVGGTI
jgi:hypothetical protein